MTSRFDLVIFDCDGILVDSERLSIHLDVELLVQLGWPLTEDEVVERWVGRTEAAMRAEIEEHLGRDVGSEWAAFGERYQKAFAEELEAVAGVADAVDAIQAAGIATCVASSGDLAKIQRNLAKTGLASRFGDRLFSADDVEHGKPAPNLFLHAADVMGADPARTAVIEDSAHGVAAGVAAGMSVFAYTGGVTPALRLTGEGVVQFGDMDDLPRLLGVARARTG
ncbi:MAG TPA: HAD-IA family hydrolase [Candidatus Limnocylindrales bacterium]|nr:HAD-IA family hydrolase [Candidatus Limnocylindrales bacterium]